MEHIYSASVIIPTYNRINNLKRSLDSLVEQQLPKEEFEVLICDDGSSEDTLGLVKQYNNVLNIKYFFQEDKGFRAAAARNLGISNAEGNICIFIDNGIILHKDAIQEHIKAHQESSKASAVLGYVYGYDMATSNHEEIRGVVEQNSIDGAIDTLRNMKILDIREKIYVEFGDDLETWPAPFVVFWTCNVSVPQKTLLEIGMFDESYITWGGEDIDLGLALLQHGVSIKLARSSMSIHFPHEKEHDWEIDEDKGMFELNQKKEYLISKYSSPELKRWMEINDIDKLNRVLLAERNNMLAK
ncbi:glycosyltransferase [Paenibacillus sp. SC116]|uniref:glycosyltransferase n=1 Tax=Paenibacillus sp. SC116 TaxID=2968986 RepID=UPI00215ABB83|nr:glycosyltransferase [Paenibacillus sp. SC116]MCR8843248.1 glycosyltransferase [Paenibacillus sp. SC116]